MSASAHLAIDLGAESGRAVIGSFDGERLSTRECARFPNRSVRLPDGLYWDVLALYAEVLAALHALDDVRPASVGIDSWGVDFGLLDAAGTLVANPLHHRDGRGAEGMEVALRRVPRERVYDTTGIQFMPINTLNQLVALDGTPALERARTLLLIPDLIAYWLTGETRAEITNASTTQLLDIRAGDWAWPLIRDLGLPDRLFPPLIEAGTSLAPVRPELAPWAPALVAVASHDTASAVVATPKSSPGAAYISSGTWSLVGVELPVPVLGARARDANLTNERGFGGTTRLLKNVMGLWLIQECRRAWPGRGAPPSYQELVELAAAAPPDGPLFDPDRPELLLPGGMPERIRAACRAAGGPAPADAPSLLRSIFESLACKYRLVLDEIESVAGLKIESVHVIGGGARNELLCVLTADITGRTVIAGPDEGTAIGNLLVQLWAVGELGSLADMREVVRRSIPLVVYEPGDSPAGAETYARYRETVLEHGRRTRTRTVRST